MPALARDEGEATPAELAEWASSIQTQVYIGTVLLSVVIYDAGEFVVNTAGYDSYLCLQSALLTRR